MEKMTKEIALQVYSKANWDKIKPIIEAKIAEQKQPTNEG